MFSICLIQNDEILINVKDWRGRTLLSSACKYGNLDIVKMLISHGADVNTHDICGITPLMLAFIYGQFYVAEYLINHGANINALDNYGKNARQFIYNNNNDYYNYNYTALYKFIRESGLKTSYLDIDIDNNYIEISLLVEQLFKLKN